jgi:hypothetical protein
MVEDRTARRIPECVKQAIDLLRRCRHRVLFSACWLTWCVRSQWHWAGRWRSRFFAHHPRTYPKELALFKAPGTFGAPFAQNDTQLLL